MSSAPIEPGMTVECIKDDNWVMFGMPMKDGPTLGSRWFVLGVKMIDFIPEGPQPFLMLRHQRSWLFADYFKPVDGEFDKLVRLVEKVEVIDMGGIQVPRYPVLA